MPLAEQDLRLLKRCYLFAGMDEADYREVVERAQPLQLAAGQTLFQQDTPFTAIYWVVEGMIRLFRVSPQGEEKVIDLIGPGRSFAEAVLFMGGNYPVCAAALAASRLIAIDGAHFRAWLAQDTWRCFRLMAAMSARMHKLVSDIEQLTLMKGTDRLLQYLLDHADPDEEGRQVVELGAPKQVIASRLGIKPETFSRLLHKLADQGLIEVHEHRIHLLDPERMRLGRGEAGDSPDSSSARFVGAAKAATPGRSPLGGVGDCAVATFVAPTRPGACVWGAGRLGIARILRLHGS